MFPLLNLPEYSFNIKQTNNKAVIFDKLRRCFVVLTPEEWVRQNMISYLIEHKNYPSGLISIEHALQGEHLNFRADAVVFNREGKPVLIAEFKAPDVKLTQQVLDQIMVYNFRLKVSYLLISNGIQHICCILNNETKLEFLIDIPDYQTLIS